MIHEEVQESGYTRLRISYPAQDGFVVLAPDSICFEDRRRNQSGIEAHESDGMQYFNGMSYLLCK